MFDRHFKHWPSFAGHGLSIPETALDHNLTVSALRYPDHPAVQYYGGTVTYAEMEDQVNRLAGYLQQRLGVKVGMIGGGTRELEDITVITYDSV